MDFPETKEEGIYAIEEIIQKVKGSNNPFRILDLLNDLTHEITLFHREIEVHCDE